MRATDSFGKDMLLPVCGSFAVDEAVDKRGMSPPGALKLAVPIGPALHGGLMVALSDELREIDSEVHN